MIVLFPVNVERPPTCSLHERPFGAHVRMYPVGLKRENYLVQVRQASSDDVNRLVGSLRREFAAISFAHSLTRLQRSFRIQVTDCHDMHSASTFPYR